MNKKEVTSFLKDNSVACIATSSKDIPSVRVMQILEIDEDNIVFNTKSFKQSYKDLIVNPNIEICFYNHNTFEQIRVFGITKEILGLEIKEKILKKHPVLQNLVDKEGIDVIKPFILENWQYKLTKRH